MKTIPKIIVRLIHIQGPLKGQIQELSNSEIKIGRHPASEVVFPPDFAIISKEQAKIIREGNRFKLVHIRGNPTFVNGKETSETWLKSGDVITLAEETGPKFSFLMEIKESELQEDTADTDSKGMIEKAPAAPAPAPSIPEPPPGAPTPKPPPEPPAAVTPAAPPPLTPPKPASPPEPPPQRPVPQSSGDAVLVVQYGPTLKKHTTFPITMGKNAACHIVADHPAMMEQHAQIYVDNGQFMVKDLTGRELVAINESPIPIQAPLNPDDRLDLSPEGPSFRLLAGGQMIQIEDPIPDISDQLEPEPQEGSDGSDQPTGKKKKSIFKKFW